MLTGSYAEQLCKTLVGLCGWSPAEARAGVARWLANPERLRAPRQGSGPRYGARKGGRVAEEQGLTVRQAGAKGGRATRDRKLAENPDYYREIGKLGGAARAELLKQGRAAEAAEKGAAK